MPTEMPQKLVEVFYKKACILKGAQKHKIQGHSYCQKYFAPSLPLAFANAQPCEVIENNRSHQQQ